jgi:hypothetical protein
MIRVDAGASRFAAADVRMAWAIAIYCVLLMLVPLLLPDTTVRQAFSEEGPFEQLSIAAWLFAAGVILARIRPLGARAWMFVLTFVLFAAREADLHKAFTADSILKTNYYRHAVAPFEEKLIAAIVAIGAIVLFACVGAVIVRFLWRQGGWRSRSGFWLLLGAVMVVLGKVVDRAPAVLALNFDMALPPAASLYVAAFEEGLEMLHPLILAWSIWISQTERRYLS